MTGIFFLSVLASFILAAFSLRVIYKTLITVFASSRLLEEKTQQRTKELLAAQEAMLSIMEDLQDSKEKLASLYDSLQEMVKSMSEGVLMLGRNGDLIILNSQARIMLDIFGQEADSAAVNEKLRAVKLDKLIEESRSGDKALAREIAIRVGREKFLHLGISSVRDAKGELIGTVIVLRDITKEKEIDRMKTEFISTVSHELRTPLSIIREGVSLILDKIPGPINQGQEKILVTTQENIDRLARIIDSLLDISRIERGGVELKKKRFGINTLIRQTASSFEAKAKEKSLGVKLNLPEAEINIYADEDKLAQVFTNLIGNSLKFTSRGFIEISVKGIGSDVECSVADSGIGIAAEDLPSVFKKFQQFARVPGAGERGTGLGLAIVKNIIELHHGRVWVESELNKGTKFSFIMPKEGQSIDFKEALRERLHRARLGRECLTLLFIDIANFPELREKLGGEKFSRLFELVRRMVASAFRKKDDTIILLGDTRIAVIYIMQDTVESKLGVERAARALRKQLFIGREYAATAAVNIGASVYNLGEPNIEQMLQEAEAPVEKLRVLLKNKADIVIVEDEKVISDSVKKALELSEDFLVHPYSEPLKALEAIVSLRPELVITDIRMPGMNGYELIGRMQAYDECRDTPVIFISAYNFDDEKLKELSLASRNVVRLNKPFNLQELIEDAKAMIKNGLHKLSP